MTLSNWHSFFHSAGTLQNATALPPGVYLDINNKAKVNRERHQHSKQYWLKKQQHTQNQKFAFRAEKTQPQATVAETHVSEDYVPSPFPEKRQPVTIDGSSRRKNRRIRPAQATAPTPKMKQRKPTQATSINKPKTAQPKAQTPPINHTANRPTAQSANRPTKVAFAEPRRTPQKNVKNTKQTKPARQTPKRTTWKPGRGAIEKIDRLSGEIFHLVEVG